MSAKNDGGPAFPTLEEKYVEDPDGNYRCLGSLTGGMSLRDWFAGQALAGQLAFSPCPDSSKKKQEPDQVGRLCYAIADAMLAEREKK